MKPSLTCPKCGGPKLAAISKHPIYLTSDERRRDKPSSMMVVIQCEVCRFSFAESLKEPPPPGNT